LKNRWYLMLEISEFDKLSRELDEEERKELLEKIKSKKEEEKSDDLSINKKLVRKGIFDSPQYKIAKEEFEKKGFWDKIFILLSAFFSGKKKEDIIIKQKLNKIKKEIQNKYYNLINFDNGQLTYYFLNELLSIADIVTLLSPIFSLYIINSEYYFNFLVSLFESEFNENIKKLYKETDPANLKLEGKFIDRQIYNKEKEQRINAFFSAIDNYKFERFISETTKFEIIIKLIQFNWTKLFIEFSLGDLKAKVTPNNFTYFKNVDYMLDNLNSIISELNFSINEISFITQFPVFLKEKLKENEEEKEIFSNNDVEKIEKLLESVEKFKQKIPLNKIFQYFKKDLLYKPKLIYIERNFIDKYKENKRKDIEKIWDSFYLQLKKNDLDRLVKEIFSDFNFDVLENFNVKLYNQIEKNFNFKLTSIYHLNILAHFINKIYKTLIENVVNKIVIEANFVSEQSKFHLTAAYHTINNNVKKINELDNKLKYENEYGKRIIYFIAKSKNGLDVDQKRDLQQLLDEIKKVSDSIAKDLYNAINNIYSFFINITDNNPKVEKYIINPEAIKLSGQSILVFINKSLDYINKFIKIYKNIENVY